MEKVKLMTDSGSDISYENEARYGIQVVPFKIALSDVSYISRVDFDNDRFYRMMEESDSIPVTSQITPFEFAEIFEEHYSSGYTDVINVSINSAGSATHENSLLGAQDFFNAHPRAQDRFFIHNIDSSTYSGCYGFAVVEAAKMLEAGHSAVSVVRYIKDWCENVSAFFVPYTLKYASRSGRIPGIAAHMGNALGIKPIMRLCRHEISTAGKVLSEKQIIPELIKRTVCEIEAGSPYCVIYGSDPSLRDEVAAAAAKYLGYAPADSYQIGAAVAANAGPKVAGISYRMKKNR